MLNKNVNEWKGSKTINKEDEVLIETLDNARNQEFKNKCTEHAKTDKWSNVLDLTAPITSYSRSERKALARFMGEVMALVQDMPKHQEYYNTVAQYAFEDVIVFDTYRKRSKTSAK